MSNTLQTLLKSYNQQSFATDFGSVIHSKMQHIFFDDTGAAIGDPEIISKVSNNDELRKLMGPLSRAEVPIAGTVSGRFISRRIDRLYINNKDKKIVVLDYKTDTDKRMYIEKYRVQLNEYRSLLKQIYPDFMVSCKILWLSDFTLENID